MKIYWKANTFTNFSAVHFPDGTAIDLFGKETKDQVQALVAVIGNSKEPIDTIQTDHNHMIFGPIINQCLKTVYNYNTPIQMEEIQE